MASPSGAIKSGPASAPQHAVPPEVTLEFQAERGPSGEIYLVGTTNLADGTKLGAEVPAGKGQDYSIFVTGGRFRSTGFTDRGRPLTGGPHKVRVLSYFNGAWQTDRILALVGTGGINLAGPILRKEDPDLRDSDKIIAELRTVTFPALPPETTALSLAKNAILTVDGSRSAATVEATVDMFMTYPGLRPAAGWRSTLETGSRYSVTYAYVDGSIGPTIATWSVDLATKKVTYVDKNAKAMSWTAPY